MRERGGRLPAEAGGCEALYAERLPAEAHVAHLERGGSARVWCAQGGPSRSRHHYERTRPEQRLLLGDGIW